MGLFSSDAAEAYGEAIASTLQRKPGTRAARSSNACCSGDETHALAQIRGAPRLSQQNAVNRY